MQVTLDTLTENLDVFAKKPVKFFDFEDLKQLRILFDPNYKDSALWNAYMANDPSSFQKDERPNSRYQHIVTQHAIARIVNDLTSIGIDPRKIKTLDLGSGNGYFLAAFAINGCPVYGVEINPKLVRFSKNVFNRLPLEYKPIIKIASYYDKAEMEKPFEDGTKLNEIGLFFCNSYDYDGLYHAKSILSDSLAGPSGASRGSIVYIEPWWNPSDPFLHQNGFESILIPGKLTTRVLRKI